MSERDLFVCSTPSLLPFLPFPSPLPSTSGAFLYGIEGVQSAPPPHFFFPLRHFFLYLPPPQLNRNHLAFGLKTLLLSFFFFPPLCAISLFILLLFLSLSRHDREEKQGIRFSFFPSFFFFPSPHQCQGTGFFFGLFRYLRMRARPPPLLLAPARPSRRAHPLVSPSFFVSLLMPGPFVLSCDNKVPLSFFFFVARVREQPLLFPCLKVRRRGCGFLCFIQP